MEIPITTTITSDKCLQMRLWRFISKCQNELSSFNFSCWKQLRLSSKLDYEKSSIEEEGGTQLRVCRVDVSCSINLSLTTDLNQGKKKKKMMKSEG